MQQNSYPSCDLIKSLGMDAFYSTINENFVGVNHMNPVSALIIVIWNWNDISKTYELNYNLICANSYENILDQSVSSTINVSRMFLLKP